MNARGAAVQVLTRILEQRQSSDDAFKTISLAQYSPRDMRFLQELVFGTLRHFEHLQAISAELLHTPLPKKNTDVFVIILTGLYQLLILKTPPHAAISESVNLAKKHKRWATGLINKTLRVFAQNQDGVLQRVSTLKTARFNHPHWLIELIQQDWPTQAQAIFAANTHKPPMCLRINPAFTTREKYLHELTHAQIKAKTIAGLPYAIQLEKPMPVHALPGFAQGHCYIQDRAGQFITPLLALAKNQTVLDACAAPGSKTTDILATQPHLRGLHAIDLDPARVEKIKQNITRLQLPTKALKLIVANASEVASWWTGEKYDRVLLDAPCSATGVIRRHPDIKILRQPQDVATLATQQLHLLTALWPLVRENGVLLYSTCSLLKAENDEVIRKFLALHPQTTVAPLQIKGALNTEFGLQLLPEIDGPDGFYFSMLTHKK